MHMQALIDRWLTAAVELPDGAGLKGVNDPSILRSAKKAWADAGRDPRKLITNFRYHDFHEAPAGYTRAQKFEWYRQQFFKFIDGTFLKERYADCIDQIEAENEFTATSTWTDAQRTRHLLENIEVQLIVWNTEFRGKWVTRDGVTAFIPQHVRLVICNGPVSNDIHVEIMRLAIKYDAIVGYHPYTRWFRWQNDRGIWITRRYENDWAEDSGRFDTLEKQSGLYPLWAFTECGPYIDVNGGWRDPRVLGGDETMLVEAMGQWFSEVLACRAYNEGRLMGWTGHWFTFGNTGNWPKYELETRQGILISRKARSLWRPPVLPVPPVPPEDEMPFTPEDATRLEEAAQSLENGARLIREVLADKQWWNAWPQGRLPEPNGRPLAIPNRVMTFYHRDGTVFNPQPINRVVNWTMWAVERNGNLLNVFDQAGEINDWWVRAEDVQPA